MELTKPFLKWVGGKTQIIGEVLELFPPVMNNYHEPFIGGGSVLLAALSRIRDGALKVNGRIYASDLNSNLIGLYRNIQSSPNELIACVKVLTEEFAKCTGSAVNRKPTTIEEASTSPESYYYWIRSRFNALSAADRASLTGSAMFLFMNKTCFRGVYREGPHGFNVPFGHYKKPMILDAHHIQTVSALIKDVVFVCAPFADSLTKVVPGDFVYLDPPYVPETATSFVGYTADGFSAESHKHLFELCAGLKGGKAKFLLSNADVKLVKEAFPAPQYQTKIISCRRAIHSKEPSSRTNEVLILGSESTPLE